MRDSRFVRQLAEFRPQLLELMSAAATAALPPPVVPDGVRILYMGTSQMRIEATATGFVYHAAPDRGTALRGDSNAL